MLEPDVGRDIRQFAEGVRGLASALAESLDALGKTAGIHETQLDSLITSLEMFEREGKRVYRMRHNGDERDFFQGRVARYREFVLGKKHRAQVKGLHQQLPQFLFLALVGIYEAYVNSLTNSILSLRGENVNTGSTGEEAQTGEYVDSGGQDVHFPLSQLEMRFNVDLKTDLTVPGGFTEILGRHNLYLHHAGTVTGRYLEACGHNGMQSGEVAVGQPLAITPEYFYKAGDLIYEVGVKLGHLLWRKLIPQQIAKANSALQDLTFKLIEDSRYDLAGNLLDFANTVLLKYADENNRLVFLINGALAAYLSNDKAKCNRLLESVNWEATPHVLRLAQLVLGEQHGAAAILMRNIGAKGRPTQGEYLRWPLFEEFRKTQDFAAAFQEIFGEPTFTESEVKI